MLTVVAALIEQDGKLLVCRRKRGDTFGLLWDFPGGKLEPGETAVAGLERELREELGVAARIGAEVFRTRHQYAELAEPIELIFLAATLKSGEIQNLAFETMEWHAPDRLPELNFLPADRELIDKLSSGALKLPAGQRALSREELD